MTRTRKVFGQVRVNLNGSGMIVFEMTKSGLTVHKLRSRKKKLLSFDQLLTLTKGQLLLHL